MPVQKPIALPRMSNRNRFVRQFAAVVLACGLIVSLLPGLAANSAHAAGTVLRQRPNVIVIMADDLGYECLGCNGGESYQTSHLDQLARTGVRFTRGFVNPQRMPESITANRDTLAANFAIPPGVVAEDKTDVVFSQPDVSDIGQRVYVIERRPLGEWFMISWQKSPFTADGKFVPVDWDPGEKTGLFIPDEQTRNRTQRGMRNVAGSTVCQMYGGTVGAYLNSADLSGKGIDVNGNPLPESDGYKQMVTPSYMFGPKETIHPWRTPDSRLQVSLDLQIPTAECAEKKGSLAYVNPLLTLVDPKTRLKISWGPMLFSKRSRGDATRPLQHIAYDAPSHSWMIRDRLVPGASWLELAPGSASYQTAPWRGWRHFSWSVSRAHVAAALENMRQQEPQVKVSIDPGDYQLTAFHLNAETHFQTAPAELGWSMRNLRIEVTAGAVSREEIEGTLKANARPIESPTMPTNRRLGVQP